MPKGIWKPLTAQQEAKILREYLDKPVKTLAEEIGITYGRIMRFLKRNDREIPRELIEQRKIDSRLKPGNVPFNKGKKQTDYMSAEAIEKTKGTRFKKGNVPHNTLEDLVVTTRKDTSTNLPYQYIRISKGDWILYHHFVWNKAGRKIPDGHVLTFIDGNQQNCQLENLKLITLADNARRNSIMNYPEDVRKIIKLKSKLKKQINLKS